MLSVCLHAVQVRILPYAGDVALCCADRVSVSEVVRLSDNFSASTGTRVNWKKCYGLWDAEWDEKPLLYDDIP